MQSLFFSKLRVCRAPALRNGIRQRQEGTPRPPAFPHHHRHLLFFELIELILLIEQKEIDDAKGLAARESVGTERRHVCASSLARSLTVCERRGCWLTSEGMFHLVCVRVCFFHMIKPVLVFSKSKCCSFFSELKVCQYHFWYLYGRIVKYCTLSLRSVLERCVWPKEGARVPFSNDVFVTFLQPKILQLLSVSQPQLCRVPASTRTRC